MARNTVERAIKTETDTRTIKWERFRYFRVFEFLQVKSDARALREALCFHLQPDGCKHDVVIAAKVGTWDRPCVSFVDAGLEALGCQDEVCLIVNQPIRGMPD